MNGESTSLFKIFRVLWFPLSINATLLGALGVLVFVAVTWVSCLAAGQSGFAPRASAGFLTASTRAVTTLTWPGFPVRSKDGNVEHARAEDASAADAVQDDRALFIAAVGTWYAEEAERLRRLEGNQRKSAEDALRHLPSRYRWIYGIQLATVFFLIATFGVAICRILALRIARDEYCPIGTAWAYAWRVKTTGLLFPVAVLLPIGFLAGCNFLVGSLSQIPYFGWLFGLLPFPLVLVSGLLIVLFSIGGLLSAGLMPAAIAVERKGTYDSLGKTFNYVFARPLPLILYLIMLVWFLEFLGRTFLELRLVERVVAATMVPFWSNETFERIVAGDVDGLGGFKAICAWLYRLFLKGFSLLVVGTLVAYALGAFTSIFLIFRRDVDGLDYTDVARDPNERAPAPRTAPPPPAAPPAAPPATP